MLSEEIVRQFIETQLPDSENVALRNVREHIEKLKIDHEEIFRSQIDIIRTLLAIRQADSILELGTFLGYSTLVFAEHATGRSPKGRVVTIEKELWRTNEAKKLIDATGFEDVVEFKVGDAAEECKALIANHTSFDFIFLDTFEGTYPEMFPFCLELLNVSGILLIDNVLMPIARGWENGENIIERSDGVFAALRRTLQLATAAANFRTCIIPSGSGLLLGVKL
ncbi:MAG: class I SAM-dependent methyltransferase [Alphaproteobacteria bacterium]|nr:class I SAM-dependent methyltransferase [Alphaproteobacteria bacterium]